jgi:hypothetical protein
MPEIPSRLQPADDPNEAMVEYSEGSAPGDSDKISARLVYMWDAGRLVKLRTHDVLIPEDNLSRSDLDSDRRRHDDDHHPVQIYASDTGTDRFREILDGAEPDSRFD